MPERPDAPNQLWLRRWAGTVDMRDSSIGRAGAVQYCCDAATHREAFDPAGGVLAGGRSTTTTSSAGVDGTLRSSRDSGGQLHSGRLVATILWRRMARDGSGSGFCFDADPRRR